MFCKNNLACLGPLQPRAEKTVLTECLDAENFWAALWSSSSGEHSAQILCQFYEDVVTRLQKKQGKKSQVETAKLGTWQHRLEKLRGCEEAAASLMEELEKMAPVSDPARPKKHISLHFDGVRVDKTVMGPDATGFCQECEKAIQESAGFHVQIKVKQRTDFLQSVLRGGTMIGTDLEVPEDLLADGNCTLQASFHLSYTEEVACLEATDTPQAHYFRRRSRRTYEQVSEA